MALVVQKYGGSSLESLDRIKRVAERVVATRKAGDDVVAVVSAMGDSTDELLDLAGQVALVPPARELDMLLTVGERISMALLAMAIQELGFDARSYTGPQAGVITTAVHGDARIIDVVPSRIQDTIAAGAIPIVAGFQGESQYGKEITTIGRGGTDTTAVALAAALKADVCEIYTDVDGVFSADPRIVRCARRLGQITYEEMLEMAACGAKVLHLRSVEYARRYGVTIRVRSSFTDRPGTLVTGWMEDLPVEQAIITGVTHDRSEAKVTITAVPDHPGIAARIFRVLADAKVNVDMVVQNMSQAATGRTDVTFTLPKAHGPKAVAALERARPGIGFAQVSYDDHVGKVSLIGAGMRSHPGVIATLCEALSQAGVNIEIILTSEIRISVICRETRLDDAVRALHEAFELGDTEEVIVYAGSGR